MTVEEYAALQVGDEVMLNPGGYARLRLTRVTRRTARTVWVDDNLRVRPADIQRATDADRMAIRLDQARSVLRRHDFMGEVDDASTFAFADELRVLRERWRALGGK